MKLRPYTLVDEHFSLILKIILTIFYFFSLLNLLLIIFACSNYKQYLIQN